MNKPKRVKSPSIDSVDMYMDDFVIDLDDDLLSEESSENAEDIQIEERKHRKRRETSPRKPKSNRNREFLVVAYSFLFLFLSLTVYLCYFVAYKSPEYVSSSYNKRTGALSASTIRGDILAADGTVLATSSVDENQNEHRTYPGGEMFSHVVGYYIHGRSGIEKDANQLLLSSHEDYSEQMQRIITGKKVRGDSVVTTLDSRMQAIAYNDIGNYFGAVMAMDPDSGKILCMFSRPYFDPNTLEAEWESIVTDQSSSRLLNRCTQGLYAPGSTFKIVTALSYLQQGGSLDDRFSCSGSMEVNGMTFHCFNSISHGNMDLRKAFAKSCNMTFGTIGMELDSKAYRKTAEQLLFNRELPVDFSTYKESSFDVDADMADDLVFQTGFGQGHTLVTPLHMSMIASAIANDGVLMKPYLIDHTLNESGELVKTFLPAKADTLMTVEEAQSLQELMRGVVTGGTGTVLQSDIYDAYGKTGTAEFSSDKEEAHSWFVGYATNGNKKLAIAVIIEEGGRSSSLSMPVVKDIFDYYFAD